MPPAFRPRLGGYLTHMGQNDEEMHPKVFCQLFYLLLNLCLPGRIHLEVNPQFGPVDEEVEVQGYEKMTEIFGIQKATCGCLLVMVPLSLQMPKELG